MGAMIHPINGFLLLGYNVGDTESWWESADSLSGRDRAKIPRTPTGLRVHQKEYQREHCTERELGNTHRAPQDFS